MGGAVASFAVTSGAIAPRGLVLSSPAIRPRAVAIEGLLRLLLTHFPDAPLDSQITPEEVTHDKQVQDDIRHDPLMHRTVTPRLVISIIDQGREAMADAAHVHVPSLFLVAGDDKLVFPDASRDFAMAIGPLATFQEFPKLFHEVFNERPSDRVKVFDVLRMWLLSQL
jgi:alpha-beta hydrolase superfamily lysophospholipase